MKICRFRLNSEHWLWGELSEGEVHELLLTSADPVGFSRTNRSFPREQCEFSIPCLPSQLFGIGDNYLRGDNDQKQPVVFKKALTSLVPNLSTVFLPKNADTWGEPEIGIIIKRSCANLSDFQPEDYILGYCLINDTTAHFHGSPQDSHAPESKGQPGFCQIGDFVETHFIYETAVILGSVNGTTYRKGPVAMMKWDIRKILSEVTKRFSLKPFDIIFTGCPERVSKERTFLSGGEKFSVQVNGLGELVTSFERKA